MYATAIQILSTTAGNAKQNNIINFEKVFWGATWNSYLLYAVFMGKLGLSHRYAVSYHIVSCTENEWINEFVDAYATQSTIIYAKSKREREIDTKNVPLL